MEQEASFGEVYSAIRQELLQYTHTYILSLIACILGFLQQEQQKIVF